MMEQGMIYPTLNLENVGAECEGIHHVTGAAQGNSAGPC